MIWGQGWRTLRLRLEPRPQGQPGRSGLQSRGALAGCSALPRPGQAGRENPPGVRPCACLETPGRPHPSRPGACLAFRPRAWGGPRAANRLRRVCHARGLSAGTSRGCTCDASGPGVCWGRRRLGCSECSTELMAPRPSNALPGSPTVGVAGLPGPVSQGALCRWRGRREQRKNRHARGRGDKPGEAFGTAARPRPRPRVRPAGRLPKL